MHKLLHVVELAPGMQCFFATQHHRDLCGAAGLVYTIMPCSMFSMLLDGMYGTGVAGWVFNIYTRKHAYREQAKGAREVCQQQ